MDAMLKGPWDRRAIEDYLGRTRIPLRLACVGGDGFPRVVSLWYRFDGVALRCVSHRSSQLVGLLETSGRVGFEVAPNEPPYQGVRGQGVASVTPDTDGIELSRLIERYLGDTRSALARWLLSRAEGERLITIRPVRLFSWDYSERME